MTFRKTTDDVIEKRFNNYGTSNDESLMSARKSLSHTEIAYLFKAITDALLINKNDIVADIGCASGYVSVLLSSLAKYVFAYDIAIENINYCNKTHSIANLKFEHNYLENITNQQVNKMFLGAVLQYFSKKQFEDFQNTINSGIQFSNLEKVYISHIPDIDKKESWIDGYKNFIKDKEILLQTQNGWDTNTTWYNKETLNSIFCDKYTVEFIEICKHITQHKYCFDLLLTRK